MGRFGLTWTPAAGRGPLPGVWPRRDEPFPAEVVRDLLGVARGIYAAERDAGAEPARLAALERVGRSLAAALDLGRDARPGTVGDRSAWAQAEQAVAELVALLEAGPSAAAVLAAPRWRVLVRGSRG